MRGVRTAILLLLALLGCMSKSKAHAIKGEVTARSQYSYVPNISIKNAIAIVSGFSLHNRITLTHTANSGSTRIGVPFTTPIIPGKTVLVGNHWG